MRDVAGIAVEEQQRLRALAGDKPAMERHIVGGPERNVLVFEAEHGGSRIERTTGDMGEIQHAALHEIDERDEQPVADGDDEYELQQAA